MMKKLIVFLLLLLSACSPVIIREEQPTQQPQTENLVTQEDIDYAETFANRIFTDPDWRSEISIHEDRVMNTWYQNGTSNFAYLDYRIYTEGYSQDDLNDYYSEETFKNILYTYYDDLQFIAQCNEGSLALYEFSASYMDTPYIIRDWVDTSNPKRIADLSMIFISSDHATLDEYAEQIFSSLPNCD